MTYRLSDAADVLVTGATGFIGRGLVTALLASGRQVVALSRRPPTSRVAGITWRSGDLSRPESLGQAFSGIRAAYYLVHSMAGGASHFRELEREAAKAFVLAAANAGVQRIVYLGGPAPIGVPSEHLRSRLEVGKSCARDRCAPSSYAPPWSSAPGVRPGKSFAT